MISLSKSDPASASFTNEFLAELNRLDSSMDDLLLEVFKADRISTLTRDLTDLLLGNWDAAMKLAIGDAVRSLKSLKGDTTKEDIDFILAGLEDRLGATLASTTKVDLLDFTQRIYAKGKSEILNRIGMKLSFNIIDRKAIRAIGDQSTYWMGQYWGDQLSHDIKTSLQSSLEEGLSRSETAVKLEQEFGPVIDKGKAYFEGFANQVVTRARELGHTEAYASAGVKYLEVRAILDGRTSEICLHMHGRLIPVEDALTLRDKLINAKSPLDVLKVAPWRKPSEIAGQPTSKLPVGMSLPPYHFNCRTTTVGVFDENPKEQLLSPAQIAQNMAPWG